MFFWIHDGRILPNLPATYADRVHKIHPGVKSSPISGDREDTGSPTTASFLHRSPGDVYKETAKQTEKTVYFLHEIMSTPALTRPSTETIANCLDFMLEKGIRHLPIVNDEGTLVGFVSDRDILEKSKSYERDWLISDIMTKRVLVGSPGSEIRGVTQVLLEERIGCIPVVNDDNQPIGMITRSDLLRLLLKYPNLNIIA
ncbi:CBS domain-containing protein [Leptospira sp. 2 VSF19]|uniref:CBS domain-containing protein n=1 Tax=Leptospira soteropolitanensis TaxID=2950025 RepID=A0AAW5VPF6_9LEPT|nr:CBS domain-containing protein [Leptospira soteropolitanensis]MCW7494441.1 CBS domain-containing protein [Leptospira soteropolitanensis]MCW7502035.1 CBS domain-containing protein [Leptospira soteropolitanensis]MCW7524287.1 CBS domain-containing protein [Leptospira soteropolitanensis]MCW7528152.1 CBS domain-containing protein [Leptospira soteropolitanensis]MCW7532005.1 CBS domain-containing protein [Leptospira soteropolitanensis]